MAAPNTIWSFSGVTALPASAPSGPIAFFQFPNAAGSARAAVRVEPSGRIQFLGRASTSFHTLAEAADIAWGSKYRVSLEVVGGSSTASVVVGKVFREDSPGSGTFTTQVGTTLNASTVDTGTDAVVGVDAGLANTTHGGTSIGIDDLQLVDGSAVEIPDFVVPNTPPVVTAGAAQVVAAANTEVTLSFTATDTDGSIAARATTYDYPTSGGPTITNGGTGSPKLTTGSAGFRALVRQTVTDNAGATASATTEVFVPVAGSATLVPEAGNGTGASGWTIVGGSATQGAALADPSDARYVETPELTSTPVARRWRYIPGSPKSSAVTTPRLSVSEGSALATVRLYEGSTLRQTWSGNTVSSTTAAPITCTLSGATIAAISDWKNLFIEVEGVLP
nr:hypothetical protein [Sphaerisporangium cinnabarinum]